MPILRHRHTANYTILPNESIRDDRLSLRDVGLLAFMLSMPDEWKFSVAGLNTILPNDGKAKIEASVKSLQKTRYLSITRERTKRGKLGAVVWVVSDSPQPDFPDAVNQDMDAPQPDSPDAVLPDAENRVNNKILEKIKYPFSTTDRFDEFWAAYPKHRGKKDAQRAFRKVRPSDVDKILSALEAQKRTWNDPQFIPYPATWLNGERWEDEMPQEKSTTEPPPYEEYIGEDGRVRHRRATK